MADELDPAAMEIPAPFVNIFQVVRVGNNVRIAFAEGFAGDPSNYRSAVVMSQEDAMTLAFSLFTTVPLDESQGKWPLPGYTEGADQSFLERSRARWEAEQAAKKGA